MPHPCPHHCPDSKSGLGIIAVLVVLAVVAVAARQLEQLAIAVVEAVALVIGSAAALAVLAAITYGGVRLHRRQARKRQAIPQPAPARQAVSEPHKPAIEGRRVYRPEYQLTPLSHVNQRRNRRV